MLLVMLQEEHLSNKKPLLLIPKSSIPEQVQEAKHLSTWTSFFLSHKPTEWRWFLFCSLHQIMLQDDGYGSVAHMMWIFMPQLLPV